MISFGELVIKKSHGLILNEGPAPYSGTRISLAGFTLAQKSIFCTHICHRLEFVQNAYGIHFEPLPNVVLKQIHILSDSSRNSKQSQGEGETFDHKDSFLMSYYESDVPVCTKTHSCFLLRWKLYSAHTETLCGA